MNISISLVYSYIRSIEYKECDGTRISSSNARSGFRHINHKETAATLRSSEDYGNIG